MPLPEEDKDRTKRVLEHMVPQGFNARECSDALGLPEWLIRNRVRALGFSFYDSFGPESKCRAGHKLVEVGYTTVTSPRTGRVSWRCAKCRKRHVESSAANRRDRRGTTARQAEAVPRVKVAQDNATQRAYRASMAANSILALIDAKERASMSWEREDIQKQIDELGRRVTA